MNVNTVIYGAGASNSSGSEAKRLSKKNGRTLLITDRGVKKSGVPEKIKEIIEKEKLEVDLYDELTTEPTLDSSRKLINRSREGGYSLVIGVGGGTVLDSAKTSAVMANNPGDISDYLLYGEDRFKEASIPKIHTDNFWNRERSFNVWDNCRQDRYQELDLQPKTTCRFCNS